MTQSNSHPKNDDQPADESTDKTIDPRELVSKGGYTGNPREIVENPAVSPQMLEQSPEDMRDDLMPKGKDED